MLSRVQPTGIRAHIVISDVNGCSQFFADSLMATEEFVVEQILREFPLVKIRTASPLNVPAIVREETDLVLC